jgi:hypothetical protein
VSQLENKKQVIKVCRDWIPNVPVRQAVHERHLQETQKGQPHYLL